MEYKYKITLVELVKHPQGKINLMKTIEKAFSELEEGEMILNNNLDGIIELTKEMKSKIVA
jgi:hypothetical protein